MAENSWNEKYTLQVNIFINIKKAKLKLGMQIALEIHYRPELKFLNSSKFSWKNLQANGTNLNEWRSFLYLESSTKQKDRSSWKENYTLQVNIYVNIK